MEQPPSDLTRELARTFFALLMQHRSYFQGLFAEIGISAPQVQVLHFLSEGPLTMRELATKCNCEPSNLTGLIDQLEAKRMVQRKVAKTDRRVKLVSVTRTGRAFRDKLFARLSEPVPWMSALSAQDQQQLLSVVQRALLLFQRQDVP
jgi:DNA-binding MarR family transcriptional regulator